MQHAQIPTPGNLFRVYIQTIKRVVSICYPSIETAQRDIKECNDHGQRAFLVIDGSKK